MATTIPITKMAGIIKSIIIRLAVDITLNFIIVKLIYCLITDTKIRQKLNFQIFLTFLYKMFREWYYKSLSVRMEIITYNFIIIFCHLVEVAIFAVGDFFSLFGIAVFYVPITHIIMFLLFVMQSYNFFLISKFFLTFFIVCAWIYL